jgi:hypothetical protein
MGDMRLKNRNKITEDQLRGTMRELEHRIEILLRISDMQEISGHHDLARSYKNQAKKLRESAKSLEKILTLP